MKKIFLCIAAIILVVPLTSIQAQPCVEVSRDGSTITLSSYVDINRSSEDVWPYVWEYRLMQTFLRSYDSIDSLDGGEGWYNVRYVGDFPLFSSVASYEKKMLDEGSFVTETLYQSSIEGPVNIRVLSAESFWRLDSLSSNLTRVYYVNKVEISAAGFEGLYTGVIKSETRKALANLKEILEDS